MKQQRNQTIESMADTNIIEPVSMETTRKLATIAQILNLQPIEGADAIEVATIRGWTVVVKKGEFNVGDLCVYCEIDSVLPEKESFEFLRSRRFRIKTIRLKGQVSQGIAFPLSVIEETTNYKMGLVGGLRDQGEFCLAIIPSDWQLSGKAYHESVVPIEIGTDLTSVLGITKYEPMLPANLRGVARGNFPSFLIKTDEERIQNMPAVIDQFAGVEFSVKEKLDGSSMTVYLNNDTFGVCSRNLDLQETEENSFWVAARRYALEEKMRAVRGSGLIPFNFALQGELIGPGIQGNKYKLPDIQFHVFNVFNIDSFNHVVPQQLDEIICSLNEIEAGEQISQVPTVDDAFIWDARCGVSFFVQYAEAPSALNPNTTREGIVLRPKNGQTDNRGSRVSFKVISPKFLLKYDSE